MSSSEGSFSSSAGSFTQRLQSWAQPSARDVADDYHVTIWMGDLNYRCAFARRMIEPTAACVGCMIGSAVVATGNFLGYG